MKAMGAYLWELRDQQHVSRQKMADQLGTSRTQIERIDRGDVEAGIGVVLAYAKAVGANLQHIQQLRLQPDATPEDGRALATRWINDDHRARLDAMIEESGDEQMAASIAYLRNLPPEDRLRAIAELSAHARERRAGADNTDARPARRGWTPRRDRG